MVAVGAFKTGRIDTIIRHLASVTFGGMVTLSIPIERINSVNKKLIIAIGALLALPLLSACNPIIVGDSIANMSRSEISSVMPDSKVNAADGRGAYNAGVNGDPGTGLEAVTAEAANVPANGWIVVELGSNNFNWPQNNRIWFIMQVVNAVPDNKCIAWVTPYVSYDPNGYGAGWEADLKAWLPNQPCRGLVQWDDAARANPSYIQPDLVHPTAAGRKALACLIAKRINIGGTTCP